MIFFSRCSLHTWTVTLRGPGNHYGKILFFYYYYYYFSWLYLSFEKKNLITLCKVKLNKIVHSFCFLLSTTLLIARGANRAYFEIPVYFFSIIKLFAESSRLFCSIIVLLSCFCFQAVLPGCVSTLAPLS